jgi:RHS repeat-associated protein
LTDLSQETKTYDSGFTYFGNGSSTGSTGIYGKLLSDTFYDYGQGSPGPVLKTINNSWLALTNSNYLSANLLNLTASQQTTDSSSTQRAYVTYGYDGGSLLSSGVTTQFTSPPNGTSRGNQTTINHWVNTTNSFLTTTNTYYDTGMLGKTADPANDTTQYSYSTTYDGAYLTSIQDALSHTITFTFDFNTGEMLTKKDANSQTTSYSFDNMRRLASISYPDGGKTTYTYAETATPFSVTTTDAITSTVNKTEVEYVDGFGRGTRSALTSDPEGTVNVDTTYDALGGKSTVSNPYRSTSDATYGLTTYQYDGLGRVTLEIPPDGSSSSSNNVSTSYSGSCTTLTDQAGKQRKTCGDGLGRLIQVFEAPNTLNFETDYQYDTIGDLTQITQKGNAPNTSSSWRTRTGTYDSLGRLLSATSPETGNTTWTYDVDSNITGKTDARSITITYGYDALHRLTSKTYSNGDPSVRYNYDQSSANGLAIANGIGRETSMSDASGNSTWSFDSMGRALTDQRTISISGITSSAVTKTAGFHYNLDGSVASITYPSGRVVNYGYDAAANAVSVTDNSSGFKYVSNVTYAPQDALAGMNLGATSSSSGIVLADAYNNRLQPATITATSPSATLLSRTYSFNSGGSTTINNGTLVKITNNVMTARSQNFTYDDLNRLTSAYTDGTNWGDTYTIDAWGNLTNKTPMSGKTQAENLQSSALTSNQLTGFSYDANGNLTTNGSVTYLYDAENRIKSAAGVTYVYNGDGERVAKSGGTLYWHGSNNNALSESDTAGNITNDHIFFGGQRVARVLANGTVYFHVADHLGSATVIASSSGSKLGESDYYPYGGEMVITADSSTNHYKFTGKERDPETGLDYFSARHYSSAMGRFMTPDWSATPSIAPYAHLGNPQTLNLYGYVENNPITGMDPDGHVDWQIAQNGSSCYAGSGQCTQAGVGTSTTQTQANQESQKPCSFWCKLLNWSKNGPAPTPEEAEAERHRLANQARNTLNNKHVAINGRPAWMALWGKSDAEVLALYAAYMAASASGHAPTIPDPFGGKPNVTDPGLQEIVDHMWQPGDKVPGGTAGAVRWERETGQLLSPKGHVQDASDTIGELNNFLKTNPGISASDQATAKELIRDLQNALNGN